MAKLLVVEDNQDLCEEIRDWLLAEHHIVETVFEGEEALSRLKFYDYDLVVLDWQLPGKSGIEVCQQLRSAGKMVPVLMLTGKSAIDEKEAGFDAGADDYLTKPFQMRELLARIRALLRRPGSWQGSVIRAGDLMLDAAAYRVARGDVEIHLQPKEFALLEFFMRHPGQVFTAEHLIERLWSHDEEISAESIRKIINRIRRKVDVRGRPSILRTVFGVGYELNLQDLS